MNIKRISGGAFLYEQHIYAFTYLIARRDNSVEVNDLLSSCLLLANFVEHILFGALHLDNCPQLLLTSSLCLLIPREEEKEKKGDSETGGRCKGSISWLERGETED